MRKIDWRVAASVVGMGVGMLLAGHSLVGCADSSSGSSHPAVSQLRQGVNLLDVRNPKWGVNAAYAKGGHAVFLETRVGMIKPDVYRQAYPNEPPNEMDLRLVDDLGNTFYVQRGGDKMIDSTWEADLARAVRGSNSVTADQAAAYWDLAQEGAHALALALPTGFKDHAYHFSAAATLAAPHHDTAAKARLTELSAKYPTMNVDYASWGSGSAAWTQYYTQTWHKGVACFFWACAGTHTSAVQYVNPNKGYWSVGINACNHGTCGGGSGTSSDCYSVSGAINGTNQSITGEGSGSISTISGGCNTGYNWDTPPGHECNEDAAYELWQTYSGSTGTALGDMNSFDWEGDGNGHNYACNCNNSPNGCSGDWSGPTCP